MDEIKKFQSECKIYNVMKRKFPNVTVNSKVADPFQNMEMELIASTIKHVEDVFAYITVHFSESDKEALWAHYVDGLSIREAADQFQIPYYTLKLRMKRILTNSLAQMEKIV